jgi:hypothetical protein
MVSNTLPVYKSGLQHPDESTLLVAGGTEVETPLCETASPRIPPQYHNLAKTLSQYPSQQESNCMNADGLNSVDLWTQLETKSLLPISSCLLERVQDLPAISSARSLHYTAPGGIQSTGSLRKIQQLTGLNLNIGTELLLDANYSPQTHLHILQIPQAQAVCILSQEPSMIWSRQVI